MLIILRWGVWGDCDDVCPYNKQLEEWKKKYTASQEELKKVQRALAKELGEGVTAEQVLSYICMVCGEA